MISEIPPERMRNILKVVVAMVEEEEKGNIYDK